jgi:hypothetical protein
VDGPDHVRQLVRGWVERIQTEDTPRRGPAAGEKA